MKLSLKSDYATRAVLALAQQYPNRGALRLESLATLQSIPPKYLVQILLELKAKNIVNSIRGKDGGYLLARAPAEITFGEVLRCIHGEVFDTAALAESNCPPELRRAWMELQRVLDETANNITFQELLDRGTSAEQMYYI